MLNRNAFDTPVRSYTAPADDKLMKLSQKENFAIFLLRGILSVTSCSALRSQIPINLRNEIEIAAMQSIQCIKDVQRIRMMNNPDPKKREPK